MQLVKSQIGHSCKISIYATSEESNRVRVSKNSIKMLDSCTGRPGPVITLACNISVGLKTRHDNAHMQIVSISAIIFIISRY